MEIVTTVAADGINKVVVAPLLQQIDDIIHLLQNRGSLQAKVKRMELFLQDICNVYQNQQRALPESIQHCLDSTRDAIGEARSLIDKSQLQQRPLGCPFLFCNPRVSRHIRKCNSSFYQNLTELQTLFSTFASAQQVASSSAPPPAKELLQPLPEWGIVGMDIQSAETQLQMWLTGASQHRIIGVYGMAGVGKTTLLRSLYNLYKKVSDVFDVLIWVTVSQDCKIYDLQSQIAEAIHLDLSSTSNIETRKMMLSASLSKKKFLLIMDDMWNPLDLQEEIGVTFGDKDSKVVLSTRSRDLALAEAHRSLKVEPLSMVEGRELFQRVAFRDGHVPEELKECAREIADECKGLPLAITVVAAAMRSKTTDVDEWNTCLSLMKNADPSFPETHPRVDKQLYQRLRWSYDDLHNPNLQNCFLHCAMRPEDYLFWVDELVQMWIAEGFVKSKEATYSKDLQLGYRYVKLLIDRGLFQNVNFERQGRDIILNKTVNIWKRRYITVHDVLRDMAIYISEKEHNYLCRAGQRLKQFPHPHTLPQYCKRISLDRNQIESLPNDFVCPKLVSLNLWDNPLSHNVPENFLMNLTSLRVLDLSHSRIESVPASLTQLTLLEYLDLNSTRIKELPQDICNLSQLRFLILADCEYLTSLPYTIGKLTQLQHLMLDGCNSLVLPSEISQVTSLKRLRWDVGTRKEALKDPTNVIALKGLTNLTELSLSIFLECEADEIMGPWVEMRHLSLSYNNSVNNTLPQEMQNMKKLESLQLTNRISVTLPNWICEFEHLERLELRDCSKELPLLETLPNLKFLKLSKCVGMIHLAIGSSQEPGGFPRLETLVLQNMPELQSITCPSSCEGGVLKEGTLSKLCILKIRKCPALKQLPIGMEKLSNLKALYGYKSWWESIIWKDSTVENFFPVYLKKFIKFLFLWRKRIKCNILFFTL